MREQARAAGPQAAGGQAGGSLARGAEEQQQEVPLQAVEEAISGPGDSRTQHVRSREGTVVAISSVPLPEATHAGWCARRQQLQGS